jgi:molybdopterin molybdotransferase
MDEVMLSVAVAPGANVRERGESVGAGTTILPAGNVLTPGRIALLAAVNSGYLSVVRRPRIALLSTGNELVPVGAPIQGGQIRDVNSVMLAGLIAEAGGDPVSLGVARDTPDEFLAALGAAGDADGIITSGGVSVGTYDVARAVLAEHGALDFWRVRMRPGGPVAFGMFGEVPVLALPGNPVAAYVAFALLARPALARMLGQQPEIPATIPVRLMYPVSGRVDSPLYLRARLAVSEQGWEADTAVDQTVGNIAALATADALIIVPAGVTRLEADDIVSAIPLHA